MGRLPTINVMDVNKFCKLYRLNSKRKNGLKSRLATTKNVSKRKFNFTNEERIEELQQVKLKKTVESKCNWAVTAYVDWRNERLRTFNYDFCIYEADLLNFDTLTKETLNHSLCRFVPEVTKTRGDGPYPGKTLYQMVVAIQKYLWVNRIFWQLIEGIEFVDTKTVLNNVMMERTKMNLGVVTNRQK